jgi:hypothetical protein
MAAWQHGSMAAWQHGSMAAWQHGSMAAWQHGNMEKDSSFSKKELLSNLQERTKSTPNYPHQELHFFKYRLIDRSGHVCHVMYVANNPPTQAKITQPKAALVRAPNNSQ